MANILIIILGIVAAIGISLFFEESREWLMEVFEYIITFEWLSDIWDFIGGMFEDLGNFSLAGLILGFLGVLFIFLVRNQMLIPFLENMPPGEYYFWGGATYLTTFIGAYLLGRRMVEND